MTAAQTAEPLVEAPAGPFLALVPTGTLGDVPAQQKRWYKPPLPPYTDRNAHRRCDAITKTSSWDSDAMAGAVLTRAVAENV